ncbi:MAG: hypothetical protein JXA18_08720, partial [Chitinispirillaceae bacterium]|nr:hypothetical protein [Chitinispirillaceae bacterium]
MKRLTLRRFLFAGTILACAFCDSWAILPLRSSLSLPGIAKDVEVRDSIAYVSTDSGLAAVDVSDPAVPVLKSFLRLRGFGNEVSLSGERAFVTDGEEKAAHLVDISNPESLHTVVSTGDSCGYVWGVASKEPDNFGTSLAAIASLSGLTILAIDGNGQVTLKSRFNPYDGLASPIDSLIGCDSCTGGNRWIKTDDVALDSTLAYVLYYDYTFSDESVQRLMLKKIDLVDPLHPQCVDSLTLHRYGCALDVADGYASIVYTGNAGLDFAPGMDIIEAISSPMTAISTAHLPGPGEDVVIAGSRV